MTKDKKDIRTMEQFEDTHTNEIISKKRRFYSRLLLVLQVFPVHLVIVNELM